MRSSVAQWLRALAVVALHVAALAVMWLTEFDGFGMALFLLTWGVLKAFC